MVDSAVLSPVWESREDLKWKVLIAGVLHRKVAVSGGLDLWSAYRALRLYLNEGRQNGMLCGRNDFCGEEMKYSMAPAIFGQVASGSLYTQSMSYIAALQDPVARFRFVVTKRGYVGVVPNMTEVGDVVVVLKSGRVPFILQQSETRTGAFRLVGECYIHGIMNGESLSLYNVSEKGFRLH